MPWKTYKDKDDEGNTVYCVHKLNDDGGKGERVKNGCYSEKSDAEDRMSALYASESDGKSVKAHGSYDSKEKAEEAAEEIGCSGAHKEGDKWVPCSTKKEYEEIVESSHDEDDDSKSANVQDRSPDAQNNMNNTRGENGSDPESQKAESFNQKIREVTEAWHEEHRHMGFVNEVFPDSVIVRVDRKHWRVPYTRTSGSIDFADNDQWQKVEKNKEWVATKSLAIKSLDEDRIGGYLIIFGDEDNKDLHDEYFTKDTEEVDTIFKGVGALPWIFHHGIDETVKAEVHGVVDTLEKDDTGWWFEAKVKEQELYKKYVEPLINSNKLYSSSGTLPTAKRVDNNGEIKRWPVFDATGTHIPAEWRMLERPISEMKSAYKAAGIDISNIDEFADEDEDQEDSNAKGVEETRLRMKTEMSQRKLELLELELV